MEGILNILKPPHMTSYDVVAFIRKTFNIKKVGHTGTLDPMASGVLPICLGKATKISQYLLNDKKRYRCEMILGYNTDTQDKWGKKVQARKVECTEKDIIEVFDSFKGEISQVPPMYSALKRDGKKLYELAREGKTIERQSRKIQIYDLKILSIKNNRILFDVFCSKGTYVRTLCEDIGNALNCGAYMSFLLRTQSGKFTISQTVTLETIQNTMLEKIQKDYLFPLDYPLQDMPKVSIKNSFRKYVLNGNRIALNAVEDFEPFNLDSVLRVYVNGKFTALGKVKKAQEIYIDIDKVFH